LFLFRDQRKGTYNVQLPLLAMFISDALVHESVAKKGFTAQLNAEMEFKPLYLTDWQRLAASAL